MISRAVGKNLSRQVRDFYRSNPFPDFSLDKYHLPQDLYRQANPYALLLDEHIPLGARVIDLGCGTGQLSCLLSLRGRSVVGVDFSAASLAKARLLRERLDLKDVRFELLDLSEIDRGSVDGPFDVIVCNGVLPCLPDARRVFARLCLHLAKPGTHVVLGLYHTFGRSIFRLRRWIGANGGEPLPRAIQQMMAKEDRDPLKIRSWVQDQMAPPVEFCYRATEILAWFRENQVHWIRSLPALPGGPAKASALLNGDRADPKTWLWIAAELLWFWTLRNSGGYFVAFGRKAIPS